MTRFAAILCAASLLAGCASDPLQGVPRLSDSDVSDTGLQAAIRAEPGEPQALPPQGADGSDQQTATADDTGSATPAPTRGGFLGFLRRAADEAKSPDTAPETLAALPPTTATDATPPAASASRPSGGPGPNDPDYRIVEIGTVLPFGALARVCNVPDRQLGKRVAAYSEKRGAYRLYDSQPGNTAAHTFYLTGFDDGCARQFTAALVMFGAPETHEQLRYGLPSQVQPYSATDAAYESLKSRVCRVGKGKPCGSAMSRLSRNTVFVSVYEQFGSNAVWKTILLHDGEVIETDIRGN